MQDQAKLMKKHLEEKEAKQEKKRQEMAAARAKYKAAQRHQNKVLRERANKNVWANILTLGIYGAVTKGEAAEERR